MRLLKTVNFGTDGTGLTTVGYILINDDGTENQARTATGVFETKINSGVYASYIDFDQKWNGIVLWDTGELDEPVYASEEYNYLLEDTTSTINLTIEAIEESGGKLDTIYQKLPENGIADAQDSTTIINTTLNIENTVDDIDNKVDIIDNKIDSLTQDTTNIYDVVIDIDNKVDIIDNTVNDIDSKIDVLGTDCTNVYDVVVDIDNKTDIINNTVNDIDSKVDNLAQDSTTIINTTTRIEDKVDIIDNKIDNIDLDTTNILNVVTDIESKVDIISDDLKRVLGLIHENIFIDLPTYDNVGNLIGARVRIYSDSSSVGSNANILSTYIIESDTDDEPGKFNNWKQTEL